MKKSNFVKLDLDLYEETLDNGLKIFIVPKDNVNGIYVTLSTKFGSTIQEFVPNGKKNMQKVPLGVAHFLEHKMFEQKDGIDPFTFFSSRGCDANANTSNYKTTYLFSGANAFEENLNYLLDYVQEPYFTDENVNKEKGIIEQELKMYNDDPFYKMYDGIIYNSFVKHPIKYPIGGTVEEVYKITKEDLYKCYNTFYNPANMFMVITGNVDPKETINLIKINQDGKKFEPQKEIIKKKYDEPNKVEKEYEEVTFDVEIPKVAIAYKIDCSKLKMNMADIKIYLGILMDLKFGATGLINEKLRNRNLISHDIDFSLISTDKHVLIIIMAESNSYKEVLNEIEEEMKVLKITEEELERKRKLRKSSFIYKSDSIYAMNSKIMNNIINYNKVILDEYKKTEQFTLTSMDKIIKSINLDNKTVYILKKS